MIHKITGLSLQKQNKQRVNIYLDGEFAFGLARIVSAWLEVGHEISDEKIAELKAEDARETAYQAALRLLDHRPRSETEIRLKLASNQIPEADITATLERLRGNGLVNDEEFARQWVDNRVDLRPRSRRALAFELRQRGVSSETIEASLGGVKDEEMAYQVGLKHARRLQHLEYPEFKKKMYAFLGRRGFDYETCAAIATRLWAEQQEDRSSSKEEPL